MKRSIAQKQLDRVIKSFAQSLADILFEARMLLYAYEAVSKGEVLSFDAHRRVVSSTQIGNWYQGVIVDLFTGGKRSCATIAAQRGDKKSITQRFPVMLNGQVRWLLVSSFEAYERFLRELYAVMGYCDHNLWRCADFGNSHRLSDVGRLSLKDHNTLVRQSSDLTPRKIRTLIAHRFGKIQTARSLNAIHFANETMSYGDYLDYIELLRHVIVHEDSSVDIEAFFVRLQRAWRREDPLSHALKTLIVHSAFRFTKPHWTVWLIREKAFACPKTEVGPFDTLARRLGTDACLCYEAVASHFGVTPYWTR